MSIRDDLIPLVDELREDVIDGVAGLRIHTVQVHKRTWSSGTIGQGFSTGFPATLSPKPRVREPTPRLRQAAPGKYEDGDRIVDRISLTYTQDDLDGGDLASNEELFWTIDGDQYRVVAIEELYLQWRVHLRRMRNR